MRKWLKYTLYFIFGILFILILGLHLASPMFRGPFPNDFKLSESSLKIKEKIWEGRKVRYIERFNGRDSLLIMVHGAPGSWDAFTDYLNDDTLAKAYNMISIDRLGYGYSDYGNCATIEEQINFVNALSKLYPSKCLTLMGHSYGAPIIAAYEMKYGGVDKLILLGPVVDPDNEKIFLASYVCKWKLTRWIFPKWIQVATEEKFEHAEELEKIRTGWNSIATETHYVYDENDWIAPGKENMEFTKAEYNKDYLFMHHRKGKSHFIPWNDKAYVKNLLGID